MYKKSINIQQPFLWADEPLLHSLCTWELWNIASAQHVSQWLSQDTKGFCFFEQMDPNE
jgi:hypothetical protein